MSAAYRFQKTGDFVIEDYNRTKAWSSFFPGIAGLYGIPLWVFYVNRGQCIASAGIRTKDEAMMEYLPANKAYQLTPTQGFRTFIKVRRGKKQIFYEPFSLAHAAGAPKGVSNSLTIRPYELELTEVNIALGLKTQVLYFCLPGEPYAALVRCLTVTNLSSQPQDLAILDGLAALVPYGVNNFFLKEMSRTIEAWMTVENMDAGIPLYKLSTDPRDTAQVAFVKGAHFYMGFEEGKTCRSNKVIADPQAIFGQETDLIRPLRFEESAVFAYPARQAATNKMACAFSFLRWQLKKNQGKSHISLVGHVFDAGDVKKYGLEKIDAAFIRAKRQENRRLVEDITDRIFTASGKPVLDQYARQTYLDNVLRGGLPVTLGLDGKKKTVYVFSRKHGDLERDYNRFVVTATYFSEGEGNYRDVNQNRRSDVFFNPDVGDQNVRDFLNLIQLDGYNPLIYKGRKYSVHPDDFVAGGLADCFHEKDAKKLAHILSRPFSPGEVFGYLSENQIRTSCSREELIRRILSLASSCEEALFGEGYWSDHWTYNTELLESFYALYPERMKELLFEDRTFTYFDSPACVKPRSERYSVQHGQVRQYHAVYVDEEKNQLIQKRHDHKNKVRTQNGDGDILKTTLIDKLVCLITNKLATLDPYGVGVEMEADKPNWYDALNGLPGLLGSSLSETFEIKRLVLFLKKIFEELHIPDSQTLLLVPEVRDFMEQIKGFLESPLSDEEYWDESHTAKESYRARVRRGVSVDTPKAVTVAALKAFFELALRKLNAGIAKGCDKGSGQVTTYFSYTALHHETHTDAAGKHRVVVRDFRQRRLPLFLEGFVHALRTERSRSAEIHRAVKRSPLWDRKLGMYKVNASLQKESYEIGRARAFAPGWLENESIWLHMEYKYLLELLKNGLTQEFYESASEALVCFQKAGVYGRSILENSSFIASSAHVDPSVHGQGFVARLSGSTAEFIQMWILLSAGPRPFFLDAAGELSFRLEPALSRGLFTAKARQDTCRDIDGRQRHVLTPASAYAFLFLGRTVVTYLNPKKKDTFGKNGVRVVRIRLYDGEKVVLETEGNVAKAPFAAQVRDGRISRIEADLG